MDSKFVKAYSTGKSGHRSKQLMRLTEYSVSTRLVQTDVKKKVSERDFSQPVRIRHEVGLPDNPKSVQKGSKNRMLPERLPTAFSNRKNILPTAFSNRKNILPTDEKPARRTPAKSATTERRVRRILNFNDATSSGQKTAEKKARGTAKKSILPVRKENPALKSCRKSLLLPPNTIKQIHVKRCSRISEMSEAEVSGTSSTEAGPGTRSGGRKAKTVVLTVAQGSTESTANLSGRAAETIGEEKNAGDVSKHSEQNDRNHVRSAIETARVKSPTKPTVPDSQADKIRKLDQFVESLCNDLENTKIAVRVDDVDAVCTSETICVNREDMTLLANDLRHLIQAAEENVAKLKSALSRLTKLSVNSSCASCAKRNADRPEEKQTSETNAPSTETEIFSEIRQTDAEVPTEDTSREEVQTQDVETEPTTVPVDSQEPTAENSAENQADDESEQIDESDKENVNVPALESVKSTPNAAVNDSFLELENKLNITHAKRLSDERTVWQNTPIARKPKQKRGERSLREYMVLKSTMSFLETPDAKRFRSLCVQDSPADRPFLSKSNISNKILTDLRNLYAESPGS